MAQREKVEIDTVTTNKNRYSIRVYSDNYDLVGKNYEESLKGLGKGPKFYSYSIENLSNKINVDSLRKKYAPKGYPWDYFSPGYTPSRKTRYLLDSLFRIIVGEETLKKSFFDNTDTTHRQHIDFDVIYDLAGKVAEVTLINFTTSQPAKFDIKDVEKMEEIIKTYADFVPNKTSDNSKIGMEIYPKINYFKGEYSFYLKQINANIRSNNSRTIEVPKFNIQPKAN
jgi:hypothetical protein